MEENVIKIKIYGTEYPIRGESDVEYIKKVAEFVDQKMTDVDRNTSSKSTLKVAILTALNIADELFRERAEKEALLDKLQTKIDHLAKLIDAVESHQD